MVLPGGNNKSFCMSSHNEPDAFTDKTESIILKFSFDTFFSLLKTSQYTNILMDFGFLATYINGDCYGKL